MLWNSIGSRLRNEFRTGDLPKTKQALKTNSLLKRDWGLSAHDTKQHEDSFHKTCWQSRTATVGGGTEEAEWKSSS